MSKNKYITPDEFHAKAETGELKTFRIQGGNAIADYNKKVIDSIREINKKDPGFRYSCECTDKVTIWLFGYTDIEVYDEADKITDEIITQNRIEIGRSADPYSIYALFSADASPCVCPFQND